MSDDSWVKRDEGSGRDTKRSVLLSLVNVHGSRIKLKLGFCEETDGKDESFVQHRFLSASASKKKTLRSVVVFQIWSIKVHACRFPIFLFALPPFLFLVPSSRLVVHLIIIHLMHCLAQGQSFA